ncbi:MAG: hypothetical protein HN985_05475, partial [Planctomycetaceae bacterium]|nr:hypothetical protein [Planctomycetaceae bacterium]
MHGILIGGIALVTVACLSAQADEGMWLFNDVPEERLARDVGFVPSREWLAHLQSAAVRFNSGGSGAFVSPDGLVLTNHHVAASSLQKLSTPEKNLARDGYIARSHDDEIRCLDLELNVLHSIEDVTARVEEAVAGAGRTSDALAARRAVLARIEQESLTKTGLRSDVVTLFGGGRYHLYRYKRYTDIRLVFAPERQIAFYGGDADNFEFPRHCLDICFFRVYEKGQPLAVKSFLACAENDVQHNDVVFVAGHPGHTDRGKTMAEIQSMRDRRLPFVLEWLNRREVLLQSYAEEGHVQQQRAMQDLFSVQNSRKSRIGLMSAVLRPDIIEGLGDAEDALRRQWKEGHRESPWAKIERAQKAIDDIAVRYNLLEGAMGFRSRFFSNARTLLRVATESMKPDGERLREYREAARLSLKLRLFSDQPLYDDYEVLGLTDSLTFLVKQLGFDDPLVQAVLDGKSPADRAVALVAGTTLGKRSGGGSLNGMADRRKELYDAGPSAIESSADTMLVLARHIDGESRKLRRIVEENAEIKKQAHAELTRLRLRSASGPIAPDATFTLRLAYGRVDGVQGSASEARPWTIVSDLFAKAAQEKNNPPFDLPASWKNTEAESSGSKFTEIPLNFLSTVDIVGGNSGSPVVNVASELVGIIFDGNQDSLVLDVAYDSARARAISVSVGAVLESLDHVYDATELLAELQAAKEYDGQKWKSLFDGKELGKWQSSAFGTDGPLEVLDGEISIGMGDPLSGITWQGNFPRDNYEISLEAKRVEGFDFFCGLTFPVGEDACSFILGGWGGGLVGLSSIDGLDASENDTNAYMELEDKRWYEIIVRVNPKAITVLLDGKELIEQERAGREISIRPEMFMCEP